MEIACEHFRAIIFTTFDVDYHDKFALMHLNICMATKHHYLAP